ncbi:MAG: hypothetical protein B6U89_07680 [Desulfurococcales archaeon ex4484_58]|nr:MAG: hypothetical protein B6U89_07680 [Desulfurococcales archaeon ex4484_58]
MFKYPVVGGWIRSEIKLVYFGTSGRESIIKEETIFEFTNDTLVPTTEYELKLENPYHVFYILVDDIRIGYPFKVGIEKINNKTHTKFIEGIVPLPHILSTSMFNITYEYLGSILNTYRSISGNKNITLEDLIIRDIYYGFVLDRRYIKYIVPILIVSAKNSNLLLVSYLYEEGPKLFSKIRVSGEYTLSDSESLFTLEEIIKLSDELMSKVRYKQFMGLIKLLIPLSTIVFIVIIYYKRRKKST